MQKPQIRASDPETIATRNVLLNWVRLSPGDISILHAALRTGDSHIGTMVGSANFVMWENFEHLGWSKRVFPAHPQLGPGERPAFFGLTATGRERVPAFIAHYDLKSGSYYVDRSLPEPDAALFDRALKAAADICLVDRHPPGMTFAAAAKLRTVETRLVTLALSTFAHDAKESVAALLRFHDQYRANDVRAELQALRSRIRGHWAFEVAGLPSPNYSLHDLAAGLRIGLGDELAEWLYESDLSIARAAAWLAQYGAVIEKFRKHVTDLAARP